MPSYKADVVFCIDTSASMAPCFTAVQENLVQFIEGISNDGQIAWDIRYDFVGHCAGFCSDGSVILSHQSLRCPSLTGELYSGSGQGEHLFTRDVVELGSGIRSLKASGDEANLVALDHCLDMPWREDGDVHRVVVVLTDERLDTGVAVELQQDKMQDLKIKAMELGVLVYIIAPSCSAYESLSEIPKSEYHVCQGDANDGLANSNLGSLLSHIGKSVSVSQIQGGRPIRSSKYGLFGQTTWGGGSGTFEER